MSCPLFDSDCPFRRKLIEWCLSGDESYGKGKTAYFHLVFDRNRNFIENVAHWGFARDEPRD
jgi:hypothetical protein